MKHNMLHKMMAAVLSAAMVFSLAGCAGTSAPADAKAAGMTGTILLSVNPEIEVEYDDNGIVLEIEGINDDGKTVVSGYEDYKGKECAEVVNALVQKIYEGGYFDKQLDGHVKNIVVKLEDGSYYPDDGFLEAVADGVRKAVNDCGIKSNAVVVDDDDLDEQGRIGMEKARELALTQMGLTEAVFSEGEYELDDGVYEFEFTANGIEYEYEVDAVTGKVLKADHENNDDWDAWDDDDDDDDLDDDDDSDDDDDADDRE